MVLVKQCRASTPVSPPATGGPGSGECAGRSWLRSALYLCKPLSMKHTSPQLLSPSSFSTSASAATTAAAASIAPATGSGVLTGTQRGVRELGTSLPEARKGGPRGQGEDPPSNRQPGTFPPWRWRKTGILVPTVGFFRFYSICGATLELAVK